MTTIDPAALTVELKVGSPLAWQDITAQVRQASGVQIKGGAPAESTKQPDPSTMDLTLDNRSGDFSPRNPAGQWFGTLGRNQPIRASMLMGGIRYLADNTDGNKLSTPDSAALSVTGDLEFTLDAAALDWGASFDHANLNGVDLCGKFSGGGLSWILEMNNGGYLSFLWSSDGTNLEQAVATSPLSLPLTGRRAIRVTLDVDNGAGGHDVTFYQAATAAGPFTQLGDVITGTGTTAIFDNTDSVSIGDASSFRPPDWEVFSFEMRDGIGGILVASPDFTTATEGATSLTDPEGNTWTITGTGELTARRWLYHGEVASFPTRWDSTGSDVHSPLEASGILRRLGHSSSLSRSPYKAAVQDNAPGLDGYWPMEDGKDSTSLAGYGDTASVMYLYGTPALAASSVFVASDPLPTIESTHFRAHCTSQATNQWQIRFLLYVPTGKEPAGGSRLFVVYVDGSTVGHWTITYETGGSLKAYAYDDGGTLLGTLGPVSLGLVGKLMRVHFHVNYGATSTILLSSVEVGQTSGLYSSTTLAAAAGTVSEVDVNPNQVAMPSVVFGHLSVQSTVESIFTLADSLNAWLGETAGDRIHRLCDEHGVTFTPHGDMGSTAAMGYQTARDVLTLLREAADTDAGILYDSRDRLGLTYRARSASYNQDPLITLDYAAAQLEDLQPVDDDQILHNDVTVSRSGGSSARAMLTTGALSTAAPPDGVGDYSDSVTVNVDGDAALADQAEWRLHWGTIDKARYPSVPVGLHRSQITADQAATLLDLKPGDRFDVTHPPAWQPPDDIHQLVRGYALTLTGMMAGLDLGCYPWDVYRVGAYGDPESRYSPNGSTLAASAAAADTTLSVASSSDLWTTDPADFPLDIIIGGERITVTSITGAASPQSFSVARSVNGVAAGHTAGDPVELFTTVVYAL